MDFHVLYEQIWLSEQKAQERKTLLNEVKTDITNVQKQIKETKEAGLLLKSELAEKLNQLSKEEGNVVWLSRRQDTLNEKLQNIKSLKTQHQRQLEAEVAFNKEERSKFISDVKSFSKTHDLCGKGQEEREADAKKHLKELKKQQEQLETDVAMLVEQQITITKEEEKKADLKKETEELKSKLKSMVQSHEGQKARTKQLELTKAQVSNKPQNDPEFQRLRAELETCQEDTMQGVCQALQQELDRLQRQRWQQQVQRHQRSQNTSAGRQPIASSITAQTQHGWNSSNSNNKVPYQSSSTNPPAANTVRPMGSTTRPITSAPSISSANPSTNSQTKAPSVVKPVGKFKPNLAKLRRAVDQQQGGDKLQNLQHSTAPATSHNAGLSTTHNAAPPAKQAKKVRFGNNQWK